ncbi:MAG TPA: M23 family metallopeptidase [Rhizomicrobium sp.]|jgi:murein DD-endopeptidase MepM/ murein hydrolase activator NlpD|nr:M23 family metallopeptidase [Rhizomicrobium sp.]
MDRKIIFVSLTVMAAAVMAGCMPDSPRTHLDWGVNTTTQRHVASQETSQAGARTYTYQDGDAHPTPRPAPDYVSKNVTPYTPITSQPLAPLAPAARADAPAFGWPVSGRVISDFGTTANGGKNDGINIAAAMDTPIHASASGTVTYAGDELKNYGNLVLIKHSGGFTTAYAHADRLVVSRGDFVAKGQVIGYAGQSGDVSAPQLHFEIRDQTTPVNPRSYLSNTTASNN